MQSKLYQLSRFKQPHLRIWAAPVTPHFRHLTSQVQPSEGRMSDQAANKRQKTLQASSLSDGPIEPEIMINDGALKPIIGPTIRVPGLVVSEFTFRVPLDHTGKEPGEIDLFVREVFSPQAANPRRLPFLLFLQGGPGFEAPRPTESSGWMKSAVNSYRVLLMDQRGTGKSSAITLQNLSKHGSPEQQAHYLSYFRADSIVADAELVRKTIVPEDCYGGRWSLLGQSFGGFCCATYLSFAPQSLIEVMMTGGVPPNLHKNMTAEDVYEATFPRVIAQNKKYYSRFPTDVELVQRIVRFLAAQPEGGIKLDCGSILTPRMLQTLGLSGLGSGGGFERLHYLLESFFDGLDNVNPSFIKQFESWQPWDVNPLYALMQETLYSNGPDSATKWGAERVRATPAYENMFDAVAAAKEGRPVYFTGEMVFPWFYEDFAKLRPYKQTAELLATRSDWPRLYNTEVLANNKVPVAAAVYVEDMYVDYNLSQNSIAHMQGVRQWATNEFKHSGIRDDGGRILDRLVNMVRDSLLVE